MKLWKKPLIVVQSITEVNKHIQANAATCLNRYIR